MAKEERPYDEIKMVDEPKSDLIKVVEQLAKSQGYLGQYFEKYERLKEENQKLSDEIERLRKQALLNLNPK